MVQGRQEEMAIGGGVVKPIKVSTLTDVLTRVLCFVTHMTLDQAQMRVECLEKVHGGDMPTRAPLREQVAHYHP